MIISINQEIAFNKIQHTFMTIVLERVGLERTYLNIIKVIYEKSTTNIILNEEKSNPMKTRNETELSTIHTLF